MQLKLKALQLDKRRLKNKQRLLREAVQAAQIDLETMTSKIETKTKTREDERQERFVNIKCTNANITSNCDNTLSSRTNQSGGWLSRSQNEDFQARTVFQKQNYF